MAWDGENLWYIVPNMDMALVQISVDGEYIRSVDCANIEGANWASIVWVPEHRDGQMWLLGCYENFVYQLNVDDDRAEVIQQTEINRDHSCGIGHDETNLWLHSHDGVWYIMDDGINEPKWLRFNPEEGVIPAGEVEAVDVIIQPKELEAGYYEMRVLIDLGEPEEERDQPEPALIEISAVLSFESPIANLSGTVTDVVNGNPVPGTHVDLDRYIFSRVSDENGNYEISDLPPGDYVLTYTATDYLPHTEVLEVGEDDYVIDVALLHSDCNLDQERIHRILYMGDETHIQFTATNNGNGDLEYTVERRLLGDADAEPWELRRSYYVGAATGDERIQGVIFADSMFFVSGANYHDREDFQDQIWVFNREGDLVDSIPQPEGVGGNYGIRDLAWNGELIWGTGSEMVGGFTPDGELIQSFRGPYNPNQTIAWDPDRAVLYISSITQDIRIYDREGNSIGDLDRHGFRIYGLAYWPEDPDGYNLYIFHNPAEGDQFVHKMDPTTGDTMFVANLGSEVSGKAAGAFITNQFDIYSWVFMDIADDGDDDRIDVWQLDVRKDWMQVEPVVGTIESGNSTDFDLLLSAEDLYPHLYEGEVVFVHNGVGGETHLPVSLEVISIPQPLPFSLLEPENNDTLYQNVEQTFIWESCSGVEPADEIGYNLWFLQTVFEPESLCVALTDTFYNVLPDTGIFHVRLWNGFYWWVEAVSGPDNMECAERFFFHLAPPLAAAETNPEIPDRFDIQNVYPNPFNAETEIRYGLNRAEAVVLRLYDSFGRMVAEYSQGTRQAGWHSALVDAAALPSGVYMARLEAGTESRNTKLVCIK